MKKVKNNSGSVEYICEWCGEHFLAPPSRSKAKHICCSKECMSNLIKSSNLNCTCPICDKKFHLKPSRITGNNCCSRECKSKLDSQKMQGEGNHQYGLKGKDNPTWKSDIKISTYGYRMVRVLDHPFRNSSDFVFEHRLVAEQYLLTEETSIEINGKRYLRPDLEVHHKNQDKLNNDPNNLLILTKSEHIALHNQLLPREKDKDTGKFISRKQEKMELC